MKFHKEINNNTESQILSSVIFLKLSLWENNWKFWHKLIRKHIKTCQLGFFFFNLRCMWQIWECPVIIMMILKHLSAFGHWCKCCKKPNRHECFSYVLSPKLGDTNNWQNVYLVNKLTGTEKVQLAYGQLQDALTRNRLLAEESYGKTFTNLDD